VALNVALVLRRARALLRPWHLAVVAKGLQEDGAEEVTRLEVRASMGPPFDPGECGVSVRFAPASPQPLLLMSGSGFSRRQG
jgi:hypothetical protein